MTTQPLDQLLLAIEPLREKLLKHQLYDKLADLEALRRFMEYHVFAVWDFMSLLKSMQSHFCGSMVPWVPTSHIEIARMIHEIVIEEETDEDGQGGYASHFELYLRSMHSCGANTSDIVKFIDFVRRGDAVNDALRQIAAPQSVQAFVNHTFQVINTGDAARIVAAFTFGRENLLPNVFSQIVERIDQQSGGEVSEFRYYLQRHIGLDADVHGPLAQRLMSHLCGQNPDRWQRAQQSAIQSLEKRLELWDGISQAI